MTSPVTATHPPALNLTGSVKTADVIPINDQLQTSEQLDDHLIHIFANYAVQTERWKDYALQSIEGAGGAKESLSPEKLIDLQNHVLNYNVEVSLVGTLARKTVGAVEALLRS